MWKENYKVIKAEEHFWRKSILGFADGEMRHRRQHPFMVRLDIVMALQSFTFWDRALPSVMKKGWLVTLYYHLK